MNKFFKGKAKPVAIPDSAKSEIPPRSRKEIDQEYTQLCISIGDRTVKAKGLQEELDHMFRYANKLGAESAKRIELDKITTTNPSSSVTTEQQVPAPVEAST